MTTERVWHASEGRNNYTLSVRPWNVTFTGGGPGPYDSGGATFSHAEFRDGWFHRDIEQHFGAEVLREALSLLVEASHDPFGGAEGTLRAQLEAWHRVGLDPLLTDLAENGDEYGSQRFHLAGAGTANTRGWALSMDRHTATITGPDHRVTPIAKQLPFSALLAHNERFFIAANGHGYVFNTDGELVVSTEHLVERYGLSHDIRVDDVIRSGDDVAFGFWTFGDASDPAVVVLGERGSFRLSVEGKLTERGTHDRRAAVQAAIRSRSGDQYTTSV